MLVRYPPDAMTMHCPTCGTPMLDRLIYSPSIIVCEEQMLRAMREVQTEEDAGRAAHVDGGDLTPILPAWPKETKWARVKFCSSCTLIIVGSSDQIPPEQIPRVAGGG